MYFGKKKETTKAFEERSAKHVGTTQNLQKRLFSSRFRNGHTVAVRYLFVKYCTIGCMHVIEHIIMSEAEQKEKGQEVKVETATNGGSDGGNTERLQALEAKALAEATATADAAFVPMTSLWNAMTPQPLLSQVDGPSLAKYHGKESVYVGRSVPVGAGKSLRVPIQVSTPGSVVEYSVENKSLDIGFGITAEREQGITIVKVRTCCLFALFGLTTLFMWVVDSCRREPPPPRLKQYLTNV